MKLTITLHDTITGEVKLRVPQCNIRPDGSIWHKDTIPLICTAGAPDSDALKAKYQAAVAAKKWAEIAPEHYARLGQMAHIMIETEEDYNKRPVHPAILAARAAAAEAEANQITIHLSSRGWGDYSPVAWTGDRRRPTAEILVECQALLKNGHDVDQPNQTDDAVTSLIEAAKRKSADQETARANNAAELAAVAVPAEAVTAYQSCGGDPENLPDEIDHPHYWLVRKYAAAIEAQGLARETTLHKLSAGLRAAARESSYGIHPEA